MKHDAVTTKAGATDGSVRRIGYKYDDRGRRTHVTSYDDPSAGNVVNEVKFTYGDGDGNWGSIVKSEQEHDGAVDGSTLAVNYAFDDGAGAGSTSKYLRLTDVTSPDGREVHYLYASSGIGDKLDQVQHIADSASGTTKYAGYTYLGSGSIVKVEHPAVTNGLTLSYDGATAGTYTAWDRFGRIKSQKWTNGAGSTVFDQFDYTYDRVGNRKTRDIPVSLYATNDKDQLYSHDGLHRLSGFDKGTLSGGSIASPVFEQDHNLDTLGNWTNLIEKTSGGTTTLNQTRYHNAANEIARTGGNPITETTGSTWIDPVYDANGNLTEGPKGAWSGDPNAETTKIKLIYDAWNRLVQVKDDTNALIATYEYDGRHFRIRKVVEGSPDVTFDYYYNEGWQLLEVRQDGIANPLKQFVWDLRYIDAPVCRFRDHDTNGTLDDTYYYTNDANFKVTALVQDDGTLDERYEYDPYGRVCVLNADFSLDSSGDDGESDVDNLVLFQGLMLDTETGLIYNRYRYLETRLGRFNRIDPLGYVDGMNSYAAYHRFYGSTDPSGLRELFTDADGDVVGVRVGSTTDWSETAAFEELFTECHTAATTNFLKSLHLENISYSINIGNTMHDAMQENIARLEAYGWEESSWTIGTMGFGGLVRGLVTYKKVQRLQKARAALAAARTAHQAGHLHKLFTVGRLGRQVAKLQRGVNTYRSFATLASLVTSSAVRAGLSAADGTSNGAITESTLSSGLSHGLESNLITVADTIINTVIEVAKHDSQVWINAHPNLKIDRSLFFSELRLIQRAYENDVWECECSAFERGAG